MAHQRPRRTTPARDAQVASMIHELYGTEVNLQTGTFSPASHPSTPPQLFGTRVTAPTVSGQQDNVDDDNGSSTSTIQEKYRARTLGPHNIARMAILPIFPPVPVTITRTASPLATRAAASHLLFSNVPIESLSTEQYARLQNHAFPRLFRLEKTAASAAVHRPTTQSSSSHSFLLDFYQELYEKMKQRLKVDIPVIDFNLTRLRHCLDRVVAQSGGEQTMLGLDELAMALEFYLQIDVDMFFLKTCLFNGVEPRLIDQRIREGLFCIDPPQARFGITPCLKRQCRCCHSPSPCLDATDPQQQESAIRFSTPHIHRFVNGYEAILNCPATCESYHCIYVLTCPCGQFDFIGQAKSSFAETLTMHREEGNRIIREFLIGERNIDYTTAGLKSEKKKANDKSWLYQHSTRCGTALQLFLDYNPDYWCFVPMKIVEVQTARGNIRSHLTRRPVMSEETLSISSMSSSWARTNDEVDFFVGHVSKPPFGFEFVDYQRLQQSEFFKWTKDRIVPAENVDLYNANIVAILPDNSSKLFRKLIVSLLITHAECKLNETGNLIQTNADPNRALSSAWCVNLIRRPLPISLH